MNKLLKKRSNSDVYSERVAGVIHFVGRWPKITAIVIVAIGMLIYYGIIHPITRDKDLVKASTKDAGQLFCTNDRAHLQTAPYEKGGEWNGVGLYTKAPGVDTAGDIEYAPKALNYTVNDSAVNQSLSDGATSMAKMSMIICVDQTDAGDSGKTCKTSSYSAAPDVSIHNTQNTVKLYEATTHKVIAEKRIPGMAADRVQCGSGDANVTIDYSAPPQVVYAPVDGQRLSELIKPYI